MRDLVVFLLFVVVLPISFVRPWIGILSFTFLAYNRTQDLTWGFARTLPISQFIAMAMVFGWLCFEFRPLPLRTYRLKALLVLVFAVGASIALNTVRWELQGDRFTDFVKVVFVSLLTGALLVDRTRLRQVMTIMALALGFYGAKNGLMYALGSKSIAGPGGMLKDNNDFALAMVMNVPMLFYLAKEASRLKYGRWISLFMRGALCASMLTIMSTSSRGAFLSLAACMTLIVLKSKWKLPGLAGLALVGVLGIALAPAEYRERMASIFAGDEERDESVKGRLTSWLVALNMVKGNPVSGIGFNNMVPEYNNYTQGIYNEQGTTEHFARVAHNSYLQIWAESGSIAFAAFLFMLFGTVIWLEVYIRRVKRRSEDAWILPYCQAIQISMCSFIVGATFLNRAHFDFVYQLVVIAACLPTVAATERTANKPRRIAGGVSEGVWVRHGDPFVKVSS